MQSVENLQRISPRLYPKDRVKYAAIRLLTVCASGNMVLAMIWAWAKRNALSITARSQQTNAAANKLRQVKRHPKQLLVVIRQQE